MNEAMIAVIHDHMTKLFDPEDECFAYDLSTTDATELFTSMIQAEAFLFNELTKQKKTFLEYTHMANQLVVQDLIESKGA
ncbi:hypothetical protein MKZ12_07225 [Paenibacillus sp. FSL R5-0713]|uniref:hypothetical protein n=1 Tax=Paenibacillus sp. FSL R5-0713 TaxID=2921655 RepID=UPI0030D85F9D